MIFDGFNTVFALFNRVKNLYVKLQAIVLFKEFGFQHDITVSR